MRYCFRTKLGSTHVFCKKVIILRLDCDEGKYSVYYRMLSKEDGHLMLKRPKSSMAQGKVFKDSVR